MKRLGKTQITGSKSPIMRWFESEQAEPNYQQLYFTQSSIKSFIAVLFIKPIPCKLSLKMLKEVSMIPLKYKSFNDTYRWCSFALALGLIYPNKHNVKKRVILFISVLLFHVGTMSWLVAYVIKSIVTFDIYNTTRTLTVGIIVALFLFKGIYVNVISEAYENLLKQISKDLLQGNNMEKAYHEIYDHYVKLAKSGQLLYVIVPLVMSCEYPLFAGVTMAYGSMKSDAFQKQMVLELDLKFIESKQYDSPYFQLCFVYYTLGCLYLIPNFTGFDGSFCIATSHLCMKLKLMSLRVQRAFRYSKSVTELQARLKCCIKDHQAALEFYNLLQRVYGGWLLAVFLLTAFLISCNLYQIHHSGVDLKYTTFAIAGVFHMYMPCYFASCLIEVGEQIATDMYCSDWESWADPPTTRMLVFMITRTQRKLVLSGQGIVIFNMDAFVSLMQTSYSFFTLITSQK